MVGGVAELGVLTASAQEWAVAVRRAEVIGRLARGPQVRVVEADEAAADGIGGLQGAPCRAKGGTAQLGATLPGQAGPFGVRPPTPPAPPIRYHGHILHLVRVGVRGEGPAERHRRDVEGPPGRTVSAAKVAGPVPSAPAVVHDPDRPVGGDGHPDRVDVGVNLVEREPPPRRRPPRDTEIVGTPRRTGLIDALTGARVRVFAEWGYQGAGGTIRTPFKLHRHRPRLSRHQKSVNRSHVRIRAIGERAAATLKAWKVLVRLRCCPRRAGAIV